MCEGADVNLGAKNGVNLSQSAQNSSNLEQNSQCNSANLDKNAQDCGVNLNLDQKARQSLERDLAVAKSKLSAHTCALVRGELCVTSDLRGVAPLMGFIADGLDFRGFASADRVVGRAAAWLYVRLGVRAVYGAVMSHAGMAVLRDHDIAASYGILVDEISNRDGTGLCPLEIATKSAKSVTEAHAAITQTIAKMRANSAEK